MILDIFSLSENTPDDKDELMIDTRGSEMTSTVILIIEIGMSSTPGALPSLKSFTIS